jgi:hypothetical protein
MFGKRKRAEALLAQSLYEPLSDGERAELDALLDAAPDLRAEARRMSEFVERVPVSDANFDGDLRPAVMAALHERRGFHIPILPHWAVSLAAFVVVAAGVAYWIAAYSPAAVAPGPIAEAPSTSALQAVLAESDSLMASRDYAAAYARLAKAVESHPGDPLAAQACQRMADLAFDELQSYPDAFAGYDALRHRYAQQFRAVPANFTRLNLLDEQRALDNQYAGLRRLDSARRGEDFAALEDIAMRHPASYLASAASVEMAAIAASDGGFDATAQPVRALRAALQRSKSGVTRSQLRLEIAHVLAASPDDRDRAREIYEDIASGPVTTLAEAARKSLADLDAAPAQSPQL